MLINDFGRTGLRVSVLGLGAGQVGYGGMAEDDAGRLLNAALDLGVTLIDTAHCYGVSEERIGRHLSGRRDEFVLSSKCGHDVPGVPDWTPACVRASVEESLRRLRTDRIDVMHLHSCDADALADGRLADELDALRAEGKIRVVAYSGDNDALAAAVASGRFGSIETSINIADQWSLRHAVPDAAASGLGVIAKRPIANGIWRHAARPDGVYGEVYWDRLQVLAYATDLDLGELALRFSAFAPGVGSAIMGTTSLANLRAAVASVEAGPLPDDVRAAVLARWDAVDPGWDGQV